MCAVACAAVCPRRGCDADRVSFQVFAQQHAGARIKQAHVHRIPLHIDLATDPAGRFATAEAFGAALAEAATQAWGTGWLQAEQVPIMDAGSIVGTGGQPSVPPPAAATVPPGGAAPPTIGPGGAVPTVASGSAASAVPTVGPGGPVATAGAREPAPAYGNGEIAAGQETAAAASPEAARRRRVITAVVVAAIIALAILAAFVLPKIFHVYKG